MDEKPLAVYQPPIYDMGDGPMPIWVDIPESKPRARARLKDGVEQGPIVTVRADATLDLDDSKVEVDFYEDEPEIRDEEIA